MIEGFVLYRFSMDNFIDYTYNESSKLLDITETTVSSFLNEVTLSNTNSEESFKNKIKSYIGYDEDNAYISTDPNTEYSSSFISEKSIFLSKTFNDLVQGGKYLSLYENVLKNNDYLLIEPNITTLSLVNSPQLKYYTSFEQAKTNYFSLLNDLDTSDGIYADINRLKYRIIEFKNDYGVYPTLPNYAIRRILDKFKNSTLYLDYASSDKYTKYNLLVTILRKLYSGVSSQKLTTYIDYLLSSDYVANESRVLQMYNFLDSVGIMIDTVTSPITITSISEVTPNEEILLNIDSVVNLEVGQTISFKENTYGYMYGEIINITDDTQDSINVDVSLMDYSSLGVDTSSLTIAVDDDVLYASYDDILLYITQIINEIDLFYTPSNDLGFGFYYNGDQTTSTANEENGEIILDTDDSKLKIYLNGYWYELGIDIEFIVNTDMYDDYTSVSNADSYAVTNTIDKESQIITINGVTHIHNGDEWVDYSTIYSLFNNTSTILGKFIINDLLDEIYILDKIIRRLYSNVSRIMSHLPKEDSNGYTPHDKIVMYFNDIYDLGEKIRDYIIDPDNEFKIKDVR
jgi:hypothetical protein